MKIKFIVLAILLFTILGYKCKETEASLIDCNNELKFLQKNIEYMESEIIILDNKDLCESDEAVYRSESKYKHKKKYAKLTVKIPKRFSDPEREVEENVITYTTKGDTFQKKWRKYKDEVTFDKEYPEIIVKLIIKYDVNEQCPDILGEKHKTSVIAGTHPLLADED